MPTCRELLEMSSVGRKSRERKSRRKTREASGRASLTASATGTRSASKAARSSAGTVTLWHATTTAVVPPSPEPFELLPPAVHGGQAVWPPAVAPPEFIYLGDAIVLAFIPEAAAKHGGLPVLLDVEVALADLAPDPAYIETAHWLRTVGRDEFGLDALSSLRWSGRVATPCCPKTRLSPRHESGARHQDRVPRRAEGAMV